jgi:hypothetical protein
LFFGVSVGLFLGPFFGLFVGLLVGLVNVLVGALVRGLGAKGVELRTIPNQGIRLSARNALATIGVVELFFGLFFVLVIGLAGALGGRLAVVLILGLLFGAPAGLRYGGSAAICHSLLRDALWRSGDAPRNYAEFLRYTSARHLTRQVGGGFVFRHRMLMEHFAQSER